MLTACDKVIKEYKKTVLAKHPKLINDWPLLKGYDLISGSFNKHEIILIKDTGNPDRCFNDIEKFTGKILGTSYIKDANIESVRKKLMNTYNLSQKSYAIILRKDCSNLNSEMQNMLSYHEHIMGIKYRKIFLSCQGAKKETVDEYKEILETMGFEPWVNENDLYNVEQRPLTIPEGFKESCAAVFFIAKNTQNNPSIKKEIEYALAEKKQKNNQFSIITLIMSDSDKKHQVPVALKSYFLKQINNSAESILEIIKAIPLQICNYSYFKTS